MVKIVNLEKEEWSNLLSDGKDVEHITVRCLKGEQCPWVKTLLSEIEDCDSTLDLGCGNGELSAVLALNGKKVALMDWSEKNIEFSQRLLSSIEKEAEFIQGDITQSLPFEDESYDTVFSCGVFEYFEDEEIVSILKEMFRVARKRVIIMVPNAASISYRVGKKYMELTKQWEWGGERPFWSMKKYFKKFTSQIKEYSVGSMHSLDFLKMKGGWKLGRLIIKLFRMQNHSNPTRMNQGYLLFTIGEK